MTKHMRIIALSVALVATLLLPAGLVRGEVGPDALEQCTEFAFSTEEDFVTQGPEPADGNPIISDGDLLGPNGAVCARNWDLLHSVFDVDQDLGLDAADIINVDDYLVAFSTELDSPHGQFTAGDLLVTNGAIIANVALTYQFQVGYDIGLDAVQFVGDDGSIIDFLAQVQLLSRDYWVDNASALYQMLNRYEIDIWFSTEGTQWPIEGNRFLDGDLLSARDGTVIAENGELLPAASVPADIRDGGVDFGLDAFASRDREVVSTAERGYFSTEILYEGDLSFTDGDVLNVGDGVAATNDDLVLPFKPAALELGLDALSVGLPSPGVCENQITEIGGLKTHVSSIGGDGLATLWYPTDHPFGDQIPMWGTICDDVIRFRVLYDDLSDGADYPSGDPIAVPYGHWKVRDVNIWSPTGCTANWPLDWGTSDPNGWYDGVDFRAHRDRGGSDDCNDDLALTSWDTGPAINPNVASPGSPKVPDGLYAVWLEWETPTGTDREPMPHNVRVDNAYTEIEALEIPAGEGHCPEYSGTNTSFMVRGQFKDPHFWAYRLKIDGDCYDGNGHNYPLTHYYDGTPAAAHLDDTGTTPDATIVDLHVVDLQDLSTNPIACAYSVELKVWDRTIVGRFHQNGGPYDGHFRIYVADEKYFTYTP